MKYFLIFGLSFLLGLLILFFTGSNPYFIAIFPFGMYLIIISFIVWFGISFINIQRERNDILAEIANKLGKETK